MLKYFNVIIVFILQLIALSASAKECNDPCQEKSRRIL